MLKTLFKLGLVLGLAVLMAEVEKTPDRADATGKEPTVITGLSTENTYLIPNKNGDVQLRVINGVTAATTVTIVTPSQVGGNPIEDRKVEVAKEKTKVIGPFDPTVYNNADGMIEVKFSAATNVSLEIQRVSH